jgi:hypothetical protein
MTSSDEYLRPLKARTPRTVLLCLGCLIVGIVVGGSVMWAARPADDADDATVLSVLAPTANESTEPSSVTITTIGVPAMTRASAFAPGDLAQKCKSPESPRPVVTTIEEFRSLIARTWLLCSSPSVFGSNDEMGLELVRDGSWYKLYADGEGASIRGEGFGRRGTWEVIETSMMNGRPTFQVNLSVFGSGTVITTPVFTAEPTKMRMNNMGLFIGDYVTAD